VNLWNSTEGNLLQKLKLQPWRTCKYDKEAIGLERVMMFGCTPSKTVVALGEPAGKPIKYCWGKGRTSGWCP